ncbi:MAG: pectate lyase [Sphingomicrobium sp.]
MRIVRCALLAILLSLPAHAVPKVIGQMVSAQPLSAARISLLPYAQRSQWIAYLERSRVLRARDRTALAAERARVAGPMPMPPPHGSANSMPLDKPAEYYGTSEARRIADNIVSYQTPAGGWGKNQDRTARPRLSGESYVIVEHLSAEALPDIISDDSRWVYVGTFDNDATTTEMRFLARAQNAAQGSPGAAYRTAFLKGARYLLGAQYPNGGWPQIYPLQGGYHDAVTYNDDVMADAIGVLMDVAARKGDYAFIPAGLASEARRAVDKGIAFILASQVRVEGKRTGWGQQHDPLTLAPVGARNFEPASLSSSESANLLKLLMRLPDPAPPVSAAVHDGVAWLQSVALHDVEWAVKTDTQPRRLIAKPGATLWSRFYDLKTMRPIFGDRDKTIHDDVTDLIPERRNGYAWYGTGPQQAIKQHAVWSKALRR